MVDFLRGMFDIYPQDDESLAVEIRTFGEKRKFPECRFFSLRDTVEAMRFAVSQSEQDSCYFGVLPRRGGGSAGNITHCGYLWADIDRHDHTAREMCDFVTDIGKRLPKPEHVVLSGSGGIHLYWRLLEAVELKEQADRDRVKSILRRVRATIGKSPEGIEADPAVADVARVMRVPFTLNHKHEPARPVKWVTGGRSDKLPLDTWEEILKLEPLPPHKQRVTRQYMGGRNGVAPKLTEWAQTGYPEGQRHHGLISAACYLRRETDLPENIAWDLFLMKVNASPGARQFTEKELDDIWTWAE